MEILKTESVCAKEIGVVVNNHILEEIKFFGGCNGNLKAIETLIKGMKIEDIISKLEGIECGSRSTSCTDQLTKILKQYI